MEIDARENAWIYVPMTSRVAHASMTDIVTTGLILRPGASEFERFRLTKDGLSYLRVTEKAACGAPRGRFTK